MGFETYSFSTPIGYIVSFSAYRQAPQHISNRASRSARRFFVQSCATLSVFAELKTESVGFEPYRFSTPIGYIVSFSAYRQALTIYLNRASIRATLLCTKLRPLSVFRGAQNGECGIRNLQFQYPDWIFCFVLCLPAGTHKISQSGFESARRFCVQKLRHTLRFSRSSKRRVWDSKPYRFSTPIGYIVFAYRSQSISIGLRIRATLLCTKAAPHSPFFAELKTESVGFEPTRDFRP